jgi:hypothetical protein
MRLRNRIVKAMFWTDPDLLRWPRDKRFFYQSLWGLADDSACIEDDMFGVKVAAWASPLDTRMSVKQFEVWRKELIDDGKLVAYTVGCGQYLYIPTMAEHESPRNPQSPDVPLPQWVRWIPNPSDLRKGKYEHHFDSLTGCTTHQTEDSTVPALPCPELSCPDETPVSLSDGSPEERGSYPQGTDAPTTGAIAYWEDKLDRDLTPDEVSSVKRWVKTFGIDETCVQIGYAAQDGYVDNPRRIGGALKASKARTEGAS